MTEITPANNKSWAWKNNIMSRMTMIKSTPFQGFSEAQKNKYVPLSRGNPNLHATYQEILDWQNKEEVSSWSWENTNEAGHKVTMAVGYTESSDGKKCPFFLSSHSIFKIDITVIKRLGY